MSKKKQSSKAKPEPLRPVDRYFTAFERDFRHPVNRAIQYVFIPVFSFAILGLVWMVPFPEIGFLKKHGYDTFLNWGSFFIAGMIYYYLRLAPTLSYAMLLTVGIFSFFIVQLEYIERDGGPAVWMVCGVLLAISFLALWSGRGLEKTKIPNTRFFNLLLVGPIWLWHFVFRKLKLPY